MEEEETWNQKTSSVILEMKQEKYEREESEDWRESTPSHKLNENEWSKKHGEALERRSKSVPSVLVWMILNVATKPVSFFIEVFNYKVSNKRKDSPLSLGAYIYLSIRFVIRGPRLEPGLTLTPYMSLGHFISLYTFLQNEEDDF